MARRFELNSDLTSLDQGKLGLLRIIIHLLITRFVLFFRYYSGTRTTRYCLGFSSE